MTRFNRSCSALSTPWRPAFGLRSGQTASLVLLISGLVVLLTSTATSQHLFPYNFEITEVVPANTPGNDYAPTLSGDRKRLWFCSYDRSEGYGNADLYRCEGVEADWQEGVNAGEVWNLKDNEGAIAIAADNTTVVIARDGGKGGFGDTDLYIGRIVGDQVTDVVNLGKNVNSRYWDSQPTITGDGKTIYFASNRPGGYGGFDIWATHFVDGAWTRALPLDSTINTKKDERSPYIIQSGLTLFFSSDRPGGIGGDDFYLSYLDRAEWSEPMNLGSDINSSYNELFFHAPPGSDYFYFASDRRGGTGRLDIYSGSPNIFGDGRFKLAIATIDSVTGEFLSSYVTVTDVEENHIVWEFTTDSTGHPPNIEYLPAGREYRITVRRSLKETLTYDLVNPKQTDSVSVKLRFNIEKEAPQPLPERELILFDLGEYNVPFFVTGYYRPNTPETLPDLLDKIRGPLAKATYIERFPTGSERHHEYQNYSTKIDSIFEVMAIKVVDTIAPNFLKLAPEQEVMELIVTGYVDPQIFSGEYLEDEALSFNDIDGNEHTVRKGDTIENFELSGMRAVFARRLIEKILEKRSNSGNPAFATLLKQGRIRYKTVAGGVTGGTLEYDKQRRIHVLIVRADP